MAFSELRLVRSIKNPVYNSVLSCGSDHTAYVTKDGVWTFGWGKYGRLGHGDTEDRLVPTLIPNSKGATQVSCGVSHTAYVTKDGVWTFGLGIDGRLGHRDEKERPFPTLIHKSARYESATCEGVTKKGQRCKNKARPGTKFCTRHSAN